eukprot:g15704.t1
MNKAPGGGDERVQGTANDAAFGKLSAASLGYFEDRFLEVLVGTARTEEPTRRLPPVINRGNFARVSCIEKLVLGFIDAAPSSSHRAKGGEGEDEGESGGPSCSEPRSITTGRTPARKPQVISLGAGKDSLFFRLKDRGIVPAGGYLEVDFAAVSTWKASLISRNSALSTLANDSYRLVAADLRDLAGLEGGLVAAGVDFAAPTILLAECVLVYMEPAESAALLQWCASKFGDSLFAAYEMTSPHDAFGKMMQQNIQRMGCRLPGLELYPTLPSQEERLRKAGWDSARATDMLQVFQGFLDPADVQRVSRIEVLDEVEEWELIMHHYCLVLAAKGHDAVARLRQMTLLTRSR